MFDVDEKKKRSDFVGPSFFFVFFFCFFIIKSNSRRFIFEFLSTKTRILPPNCWKNSFVFCSDNVNSIRFVCRSIVPVSSTIIVVVIDFDTFSLIVVLVSFTFALVLSLYIGRWKRLKKNRREWRKKERRDERRSSLIIEEQLPYLYSHKPNRKNDSRKEKKRWREWHHYYALTS